MTEKKKQGFASLTPERRREVSSIGGNAAKQNRLQAKEKARKYDELMKGKQ